MYATNDMYKEVVCDGRDGTFSYAWDRTQSQRP